MRRAAVILGVLVCGCATSLFPYDMSRDVDRTVDFDQIRDHPGLYAGKKIILGGEIIETRVLKEGTQIEILQKPLDYYDVPLVTDESHGRYLVTFSEFLDPQVFASGRRVTVVGTVTGPLTLPLGGTHYTYPALTGAFIQLWSRHQEEYYNPHFEFGIGVYRWYPYRW